MYTLAPDALDPRPGDVVAADLDGAGWQVLIIDHVVALGELLPLGDRGSRSFIDEATARDSVEPRWSGEVQLLVRLHLARFATAQAAQAAYAAGELDPPVTGVVVSAGRLTHSRAVPFAS